MKNSGRRTLALNQLCPDPTDHLSRMGRYSMQFWNHSQSYTCSTLAAHLSSLTALGLMSAQGPPFCFSATVTWFRKCFVIGYTLKKKSCRTLVSNNSTCTFMTGVIYCATSHDSFKNVKRIRYAWFGLLDCNRVGNEIWLQLHQPSRTGIQLCCNGVQPCISTVDLSLFFIWYFEEELKCVGLA